MKNIFKVTTILIICSSWIPDLLFCQIGDNMIALKKSKSTLSDIVESVGICKWKYDAQTCMNFSFDDNNISHKKISELFDQYNYKATFFVIGSYMYVETMKDLLKRGHEIGNHTYSHVNLSSSSIDSSEIDFQIRQSKLMIENATGTKCLSFTEPFHAYSQQSKRMVFANHLFDRDYSQYFVRDFYGMNPLSTIEAEKSFIENKITEKNVILFAGHGLDGDGSDPVSSDFLLQTLELTSKFVESGDLWVTTIKEGLLYENLYQEIQLGKSISGDTIKLMFKNFNKFKYKDVDAAPISITLPKILDNETSCLTNRVEIKEFANKYVITTDLMRDTTLVLLVKPLGVVTGENVLNFKNKFVISPNPAIDYITINIEADFSFVEIFNLNGQLQLSQIINHSKIDVSKLAKGCYLTKIKTKTGNEVVISYAKFIKV